jgi:uncharacterized protein (DUF1330 family)
MAIYAIVDVDVRGAARYQTFMLQVESALEEAGARYLARCGAQMADCEPRRLALLKFSSSTAWQTFYNGPIYQGLKAIREQPSASGLASLEEPA